MRNQPARESDMPLPVMGFPPHRRFPP